MNTQITYNDVARAAEQLLAEGRPAGTTKIREFLGRGSFTTIQKHYNEWETAQAKLKEAIEEEKRLGPPEELFLELQKMMAAYWPHAVNRAKEQMQPEIETLNIKLSQANAKNREALLEIGNLENALEAASVKANRMEDAEKRASEANERIISMQFELSRLEKIEARFESQQALLENLQAQNNSLKGIATQNVELTRKIEGLNTELNETRIKIAKLETTLEVIGRKHG